MSGAALTLRSVSVSYDGRPALRRVDLSVRAGERVALVGPSGAGKSTLLAVISGSLAPSSGEVEVLGQRLLGTGTREQRSVRRRSGTIQQRLELVGR